MFLSWGFACFIFVYRIASKMKVKLNYITKSELLHQKSTQEAKPVMRTKRAVTIVRRKVIAHESVNYNHLSNVIREEAGQDVVDYIQSHFPFRNRHTILYPSLQNSNVYDGVDFNDIRTIINLQEVNKHQRINSLFRSINTLLPESGFYVGCVETYDIRKNKLEKRFGRNLTKIIWLLDFIFNRVMPRVKITKRLYYFLTHNRYRALSLAETLGRLSYCGFEVIEFKEINNKIYFVVMKTKGPREEKYVSYGPFFPMNRIGKDGKMIKVFKMRTMHPYSEFLQDYIVKLNGYNAVGKPANDFRLTGWGRILRKLWIDELPQIVNVFRGELGLVGVRPLSSSRFNQFPEDLKQERIRYKPGCIPPYVSLCMPDAIGNIEAERIYLKQLSRRPVITNVKFFFMAVFNIATNRIRSA